VGGNRTHAARLLGISLRTLRNKLRTLRERGEDVVVPAGRQSLPTEQRDPVVVASEAGATDWSADLARASQEESAA
jgi:hypothetical protein